MNSQLEPRPAPPVASTPSQRPAPPVMVTQKSAHWSPVTPLKVRPPDIERLVEVALVMTLLVPVTLAANRFVDVAFVDVLFVMVTPLKVDDAPLMMSPSEVVGVRAPLVICQLVNAVLMKSTPAIA